MHPFFCTRFLAETCLTSASLDFTESIIICIHFRLFVPPTQKQQACETWHVTWRIIRKRDEMCCNSELRRTKVHRHLLEFAFLNNRIQRNHVTCWNSCNSQYPKHGVSLFHKLTCIILILTPCVLLITINFYRCGQNKRISYESYHAIPYNRWKINTMRRFQITMLYVQYPQISWYHKWLNLEEYTQFIKIKNGRLK